MQRLRHARFLASLVLAWFVLAMGVAAAAPVVGTGSLELVCSGTALKLVVKGDDGRAAPMGHLLDCPLCVQVGAPPVLAAHDGVAPAVAPGPVDAVGSTRIAAQTSAPPPARAPPAQA